MSELELRINWERFVAPSGGTEADKEFDSVLSRHAEPQRHYHTIDHVAWVLRHLDSFDHPDIDHGLAAAAAFYHDAIYDPTRTDNEATSAALAREALTALGWTDQRAEQVVELVLATVDHRVVDDVTTSAFCSADLAILAADPSEYSDYVNQVRTEYGFLDETVWRGGRAAVLNGFLERATIFDTRIVPAGWEQRARANIAAELAAMTA